MTWTLLLLRFFGIEEATSLLEVASGAHLVLVSFIRVLVQLTSALLSKFTPIGIRVTHNRKRIEVIILSPCLVTVDEGVVCLVDLGPRLKL